MVKLWRLRRKILEEKSEISIEKHKVGGTLRNIAMSYKLTYMSQLFKPRNTAITNDDRHRAALIMYENYICQYKAVLLQCERDFDLISNVRLYQDIAVPYFTVKHGQFAAVALTRKRS